MWGMQEDKVRLQNQIKGNLSVVPVCCSSGKVLVRSINQNQTQTQGLGLLRKWL